MDDFIIILTACLVAIAGSLIGVFLILRRQSMLSDAISHAALPGIVAAYWFSGGTSTLPALLGASAMGLLTVLCVELIERSRLIKVDAAIGSVFPVFFSIGVILVSLFFRNTHLDIDAVLYGEIAYAPLNTLVLFCRDVPESLVMMGTIAFINLLFIGACYKELKLSTFDAGLAAAFGFLPTLLHYILIILLSLTTVGAFQSVGAILIVAFIIIPATCAYLLTHRLSVMITLSLIFGISSSIIGYYLALFWDTSITGMITSVLGVILILSVIFSPIEGVLFIFLRRQRQQREFSAALLTHALQSPSSASELSMQLGWTLPRTQQALNTAMHHGWIIEQQGLYQRYTPQLNTVS